MLLLCTHFNCIFNIVQDCIVWIVLIIVVHDTVPPICCRSRIIIITGFTSPVLHLFIHVRQVCTSTKGCPSVLKFVRNFCVFKNTNLIMCLLFVNFFLHQAWPDSPVRNSNCHTLSTTISPGE